MTTDVSGAHDDTRPDTDTETNTTAAETDDTSPAGGSGETGTDPARRPIKPENWHNT